MHDSVDDASEKTCFFDFFSRIDSKGSGFRRNEANKYKKMDLSLAVSKKSITFATQLRICPVV